MTLPVRQRHAAASFVPLILNFGPSYRVLDPADLERSSEHSSFVAGLGESYAVTESSGRALCVQINLTPLGARRVLGVPMHELANRVVPLADVLGPEVDRLEERLFETPDWDARLALCESVLAARLAAAPPPRADVAWAWRRIEETGGRIRIAALAEELRCSRKHLVTQFRSHVGLPPKTAARIVRFNRLLRLLANDGSGGWAELAQRCGYYDQAHLSRDVRQLAGCAPGELAREQQVTFVQDGDGPAS